MNKHQIHSLFLVLRERFHKHVHDVAVVACSMIIGLPVMTALDQNQARQISLETRTYQTTPMVAHLTEVVPPSSTPSSVAGEEMLKPAALEEVSSPEISILPSSTSSSISSAPSSVSISSSIPTTPTQPTSPTPPSSESSSSTSSPASSFPAFGNAILPVSKTPNWGAMRTPAEWNRTYGEMRREDFVGVPRYDMAVLTTPMDSLMEDREANIAAITAKLFYSTRFYGSYNLDAGEHSGKHVGIDLKLARGTPVGAVAGGRVAVIAKTQVLGLHVVIEHRLENGETYYSVYGHFDSAAVTEGQDVTPGRTIGFVGMTGNTSAPHIHLQIDRGESGERHIPYAGGEDASRTVHPITFIATH